ncbi:RcnB family protein [Massilia sp. X63]|uniref:RcnB family protein n=1 Tax=Massilia sp. X63 TaxID=3237285 RepID=UPI0034DD162E
MNKLIVPLLVAAALAGGAAAQVHQRGEQEARAQQARAVKTGPYRSVETSGQLKRGGQLPPRYRTHHYVVENWKTHRLTEPPPGHQWVQAGSDYALVAIATGVVQEVLVGR